MPTFVPGNLGCLELFLPCIVHACVLSCNNVSVFVVACQYRCKGMWTLLLWIVAVFVIIYTLHGPYVFASFCGAYYMQHNYNLSTKILQHENIPATISTTSSPGRSPSIPPTLTRDPFIVKSGTCSRDYIVSQDTIFHCIQSPNYPEQYPSSESCRIRVTAFRPGDSLTAIDFATRVGDTLALKWYYPYKCGDRGTMSALGDWQYENKKTRSLNDRGYLNFTGLVGGPCNFTCVDYSSDWLLIDWTPLAAPNPLFAVNATGWKVCYIPRKILGKTSPVNLTCAAPAPVCAPEFYLIYLWSVYIGAGCIFLFSLFVCYCGKTIGACFDVCCWFNCGVARCCCDVCYNACVRADTVLRRRARVRDARIAARNAAYEKVSASCNLRHCVRFFFVRFNFINGISVSYLVSFSSVFFVAPCPIVPTESPGYQAPAFHWCWPRRPTSTGCICVEMLW